MMRAIGKLGVSLAVGIGVGVALENLFAGFGIGVAMWIVWGTLGARRSGADDGTASGGGDDAGPGLSPWSRDDRIDNSESRSDDGASGSWDGSDSGGGDGGDGGGGGD